MNIVSPEGMDMNDLQVLLTAFSDHSKGKQFTSEEEFHTCFRAFARANKAKLLEKVRLNRARVLRIKFPEGLSQRDREIIIGEINRLFSQNPPRTKQEAYERGNAWLREQGFDFEFNNPAEARML